jgi:phosphatidylserine/phosphatidylglycerophosphate/cardiolipin synthase-like enzyme
MAMKLKVFTNEDDALLFWSITKPIPECRGFAIERKKNKEPAEFLPNRVGFESEANLGDTDEGSGPGTRPSTEWPFQRFSWTDHDANTGDTVSYRIVPIVRDTGGDLRQLLDEASDWSEKKTLGKAKGDFKPFFNRGFVMSQFMARFLARNKLTLAQFKDRIRDRDDKTIREFLSGGLRTTLLGQLEIARKEKGHVYAALFELTDEELLDGLVRLGKRAHVVLANGSITKTEDETSAEARLRDANKDARKKLKKAGVEVQPKHRYLSPGALGHNKFLVRTDKDGNPQIAWTGSTNWAPTGLCTQVNNGLLIENEKVAQVYLDQWQRLADAKSAFPPELLDSNTVPKPVSAGKVGATVWFTRSRKGADLEALRAEVNAAREGILFLMFMPGAAGLFSTVAARSAEPNLYVRGVVSEIPNGRGDESAVDVSLIDGTNHNAVHLDIIQPEGVKHSMAFFAEEVTRKQFLGGVGHAIIHSKVVVIDPFSADPVVITGSHNFSTSASSKNDENFIIIRGDRPLAEAYAVNIMGAYAHYRWRALLSQVRKPFNGLRDHDAWQAPMLRANQRDLRFFGV